MAIRVNGATCSNGSTIYVTLASINTDTVRFPTTAYTIGSDEKYGDVSSIPTANITGYADDSMNFYSTTLDIQPSISWSTVTGVTPNNVTTYTVKYYATQSMHKLLRRLGLNISSIPRGSSDLVVPSTVNVDTSLSNVDKNARQIYSYSPSLSTFAVNIQCPLVRVDETNSSGVPTGQYIYVGFIQQVNVIQSSYEGFESIAGESPGRNDIKALGYV